MCLYLFHYIFFCVRFHQLQYLVHLRLLFTFFLALSIEKAEMDNFNRFMQSSTIFGCATIVTVIRGNSILPIYLFFNASAHILIILYTLNVGLLFFVIKFTTYSLQCNLLIRFVFFCYLRLPVNSIKPLHWPFY